MELYALVVVFQSSQNVCNTDTDRPTTQKEISQEIFKSYLGHLKISETIKTGSGNFFVNQIFFSDEYRIFETYIYFFFYFPSNCGILRILLKTIFLCFNVLNK